MSRILIADDDAAVRAMLRMMLRLSGHEVGEAADGDEAVAACGREPFDLVLCDLFMPNREGLETIRDLRHAFPAVKIVAYSGAGANLLDAARLLGADATLRKPSSGPELLAAIDAALAARPPTD